MDTWLLLLAPVTVFTVLFFFGAIGCAAILDLDDVSYAATYHKTITDETTLVAYWRLGEPNSTPVPSTGTAKSETGSHSGDYQKLTAVATVDKTRHSPPTAGIITLGQRPGLLSKFSNDTGMQTDGGFVRVPFDDQLNPGTFTFEAWVKP